MTKEKTPEQPQQGPAFLIETPHLHTLTQEVMKLPWHQANPLMRFIQNGVFHPVTQEGVDLLTEKKILELSPPPEPLPEPPPKGDKTPSKATKKTRAPKTKTTKKAATRRRRRKA